MISSVVFLLFNFFFPDFRRSLGTRSAPVDQRRNTRLVVDQLQEDLLSLLCKLLDLYSFMGVLTF